MSERASPDAVLGEPLTLESGLEALQSSAEFRGPVEPLDGHDCNDHFAQIYETREEKFEAAVPFVRHGLERGERIAYVVDQSTEAEVKAALSDAEIDVDGAIASGALLFYTVQETYLRNGTFVPDEMIQFYADATATANEEFEGLRLVAEMSWIETDDTAIEGLMEYESKINGLFDEENVLAICQYDRELFTPETVRDVVRTHPHLIYDGAACHNFYYTPPGELLGPDQPVREVDRMLGTLRDRTEAKTELQRRERFLKELSEITASAERTFEEKIRAVLELGCEWFGFDFGGVNRVDPDTDRFEIEYTSGDHEHFEPGVELPLSQTYCRAAADIKAAASVSNPVEEGFDDIAVFEEYGIRGYLGTYIPVDGGTDRTLGFVPAESRQVSVTEEDRLYLEFMGQWIGYELNRYQRERFLRECYEITSDPALEFEEKLERLLTLGSERLGLDAGGLTRLESCTGEFRLEYAVGDGDVAWTDPGEGRFCRRAIAADEPVGKADVRGTDWADDPVHRERGLTSYLGTKVTSDSTTYGTLWVGSREPREREFSDTERTFLHLMGQWVSYEVERKRRERALEESNERLEQFAYAASHDLQEPLRMVTSYLQLLENRYDEAFDEDGEEFLAFAVGGADRMRTMIDGLLEYSRVETRGDPFEPVELDAVREDAIEDLQLRIEESDAEIASEPLPRVEGDADQLRQVLQNLLSNAITYSGDAPPRVRVGAEKRGREWVISVRDEGIGIDPADQDRVFTVFDRLHSRDEYEGTGIGLALCQRIVERHGGEIWVESNPGEGATFSFTLPARRE